MVGTGRSAAGRGERAAVDYERGLKVVEGYLALIAEYERLYEESLRPRGTTDDAQVRAAMKLVNDEILTRLKIIVDIGTEFYPTFREGLTVHPYESHRFSQIKSKVLLLRGALRDAQETLDIVGVTGPRIAAADLHPTVWNPAARLWDDGHYRQAVESAATAVDDALRAKLGRSDIRGRDLIAQAFTEDDPEPGKPRLRFTDINPDDKKRWVDAHQGTMHFGIGCMMAIRNLVAHNPDEIDPQVALEQLAALSVLARWIDDAEVEQAT
jgi:uncharacterized protein (TIGR02391 family)